MLKFAIYQEGFFNFWYNITVKFIIDEINAAEEGHDPDVPSTAGFSTSAGYIPTIMYLGLTLVILVNIPIAVNDIIKYLLGKRDGKDKMTDLVRATITVDMN